jgi:hypothetical protein
MDGIGVRARFLDFAHVLIGKPVPTFPGHAPSFAPAPPRQYDPPQGDAETK